MIRLTKLFTLVTIISVQFTLNAQLETFSSSGPYPLPVHLLIGSDFLGPNFTVTNAQYLGRYFAIGSFDASLTNLGINQGVIMTTGTVTGNLNGPLGPNNQANSGLNNNSTANISGYFNCSNLYNVAILKFDFIPNVDTLKLRFVFGSEEYPEFAPPYSSEYNDPFGIFISGPGIIGPGNSLIKNIALLPNGTVVSINSVNSITNINSFVGNGDGAAYPYNTNPYYIQYDGYTKPITATSALQIGETYHLEIVIADCGDAIFDSGIFIESCDTCNFNANINELENDSFLFYPNPTKDELFFNSLKKPKNIKITDLMGKLVFVKDEPIQSLDISNLTNGTYFIEFELNGVKIYQKIVKND